MFQRAKGDAARVLARNKEVVDAQFSYEPTSEERYNEIVSLFLLKLERRKRDQKIGSDCCIEER